MEQWSPIEGHEGRYEVSDHGRVRSIRRGIILKPWVNGQTGYAEVRLGRGTPTRTIHSLVAHAFVPGYQPGFVVRHYDGDKANNGPANLRWGTRGENTLDMVRHGGHNNATKTVCKHGHDLTDPANIYLTPAGSRDCRICSRRRRQEYRGRKKRGDLNGLRTTNADDIRVLQSSVSSGP
jgi:hypothetical protein